MEVRHGSVFTGLGSADLAAECLGWRNVFQVEKDAQCQSVLRKNFPTVKKYLDVYDFNGIEYDGSIDVLTGGFPCQKYSQAGFREGNEPLAKEMLRIAGEVNPIYFVAENVYGFFSIDNGKSLAQFCADLQDKGFERPAVLDLASDFAGVQTMERHLWIVSKANSERLQRHKQNALPGFGESSRKFSGSDKRITGGRDIRETKFQRVGERTARRLDKTERNRLHQIGNAFPPQVIFQIFKAIEQTF